MFKLDKKQNPCGFHVWREQGAKEEEYNYWPAAPAWEFHPGKYSTYSNSRKCVTLIIIKETRGAQAHLKKTE